VGDERFEKNMAQRALNVLFVCERNSIRSILAEALLNRFGDGRFHAFSAGIEPDAELHPLTLEMLKGSSLGAGKLRPKRIADFATPAAPRMDFVICMGKDGVEAARALPGTPMLVQWGISDPAGAENNPVAQRFAFRRAFRELENRIRLFVLVRHDSPQEREFETARRAQNA
jgi:protein-tyrosine-phosphatase